jgi:Tfp pilus assembly protein PilW
MPTFKVGDRIPQSGFVSTSKRKKTAADFARSSPQAGTNKDKGGVLLEITVPAGAGTVDVPNAAGDRKKGKFHDEEEVLVERGGELVVTSVTKSSNGTTIVKAEFVPGSM